LKLFTAQTLYGRRPDHQGCIGICIFHADEEPFNTDMVRYISGFAVVFTDKYPFDTDMVDLHSISAGGGGLLPDRRFICACFPTEAKISAISFGVHSFIID
jgi:hypothetical protein